MPERDVDQQLVLRVQSGDRRAFDLLVKKYQHKVVALVQRFTKDRDEALDIAQEAFIKAYRALPQFRGESAFYTWLYRIAVNTAKNALVLRSRRPPDIDLDIHEEQNFVGQFENVASLREVASPELDLQRDQIEAMVFEALRELPEELRVAVMLREFDGLSYEEIAEIMACPVGTVRSRIFRAREAISEKIAPLLSQPFRV